MNHGGTPDATSAPIIEPADVPTIRSALAGSQPVSVASASRAPVSHAPPITPPAPSTSPTLGEPAILDSSLGEVPLFRESRTITRAHPAANER